MKTIIEPFKIKMVEPITLTTRAEREHILRRAHFNVSRPMGGDDPRWRIVRRGPWRQILAKLNLLRINERNEAKSSGHRCFFGR